MQTRCVLANISVLTVPYLVLLKRVFYFEIHLQTSIISLSTTKKHDNIKTWNYLTL